MKLSKIAATAAMTGALGSAALGIGAGFAQADPDGPHPGPNVPGPNVPGPNVPDRDGPGQGQWGPGQPICNGGPGANCNGPGTPLPPGQHGFPPPGYYNDPGGYGYPARWAPPDQPGDYPVVFNPDPAWNQWGVFLPDGRFVPAPPV